MRYSSTFTYIKNVCGAKYPATRFTSLPDFNNNSSLTTLTTTNMGSGGFPDLSFSRTAYVHNIECFYANNRRQDYSSSWISVSDPSRYRIEPTWQFGGKYFYLGGPGAGGVVNV
ncbi:hypothetical protein F4801DRAFT_570884 [Xylaria longipes]|nr:hypothetical protein F4801DRAFT_570884 [Xylaria longipes]